MTAARRAVLVALGAASGFGSCGPCSPKPAPLDDVRLFDASRRPAPPPGPVRAYPPHAIRDDGVGPYLLGEEMLQVLRELPEGPHLELLQVGRYANWRVARAEKGAIVIGATKNQVTFVAVLDGEVARTQSGVGVGATGAEVTAALGAPVVEDGVLRDRRVLSFGSLPAVHFLTSEPPTAPLATARVVAVVVARPESDPEPTVERRAACLAGLDAQWDEVLAAAKARPPAPGEPPVAYGCISGALPEAVLVSGGELVIVGGEPGKMKRVGAAPLAAAGLLGIVDIDGDGREEIVSAVQGDREGEHFVELRVHRWEGQKLVEALVARPFSIGESAAAGAGVTPGEIDLAIAVRAARTGLVLDGFYTASRAGKLREVAPLTPVVVKVEPRRGPGSVAEPSRAAPTDVRAVDAAPAPDAE